MRNAHSRLQRFAAATALLIASGLVGAALAGDATPPVEKGQRVFSAGHSFHMFVPNVLRDMARSAEIEGHEQIGRQSIGGSRVIQHWELPDERNTLKPALRTGEVDVLTLSPIYLPDEGIEKLAELALRHRPDVRVTIQEFWLPYDVYQLDYKRNRPRPLDRNARTSEQMRQIHEPYFRSMDEHVAALNEKFGTPVLFVVPTGQAAILLRERIIAGEAPGLTSQEDLFRDRIGHPTPPLQALAAYCHFAVVYRRTPVGLPVPAALAKAEKPEWNEELNRLLQELAWEAVISHPLSGVKTAAARSRQP